MRPRERTRSDLPLEVHLEGEDSLEAVETDPLTAQRRGFIDTIFSPWSTLRSVLTVEKARYAHCRRPSAPRCPPASGTKRRRHRRCPATSGSGADAKTTAGSGNAPTSPFGCLIDVVEDARGQHHPRRACAEGWFRWVLGLCKCRPPAPRESRGSTPVLLLSVHQEAQGKDATSRRDRYLSNGWRLSPPGQTRQPGNHCQGRVESEVQQGNESNVLDTDIPSLDMGYTDETNCANDALAKQGKGGHPTCGYPTNGQVQAEETARKGRETGSRLGGYPALRLVQECRRRDSLRPHTQRARRSAKHLAEYLVVPAMLQQILKDMYIDPELLAELDDEQKQILFCKLREEQVRRWEERESKLDQDEKRRPKKHKPPGKNGKRQVDWLLGSDQQVWVWVMGEHNDDSTIEQILEDEAHQKACKLAEQEAQELAMRQEEELRRRLQEERRRLEEEARSRQADLRRKAEKERLEEERKKQEIEEQEQMKLLRVRHEMQRRRSIDEINQLKERRSSEIYMTYKESRQTIEKLAEEDSKTLESEWREQEKKSKAAEEEIRAIARRAREEHRRSLTDTLRARAQVIGKMAAGLQEVRTDKPPVPSKPASLKVGRPPKPSNRKAIVDWFKEVEYPKGTGRNLTTKQMEPWFHGIITRQDAEVLLQSEPAGTFLVRVSERIWGYAVSYRGPVRCKHFLIDAANDNYQFFGTHQIAHPKLADLVNFHKVTPISSSGQEKLVRPCRQKQEPPNFHDLLPAMNAVTL